VSCVACGVLYTHTGIVLDIVGHVACAVWVLYIHTHWNSILTDRLQPVGMPLCTWLHLQLPLRAYTPSAITPEGIYSVLCIYTLPQPYCNYLRNCRQNCSGSSIQAHIIIIHITLCYVVRICVSLVVIIYFCPKHFHVSLSFVWTMDHVQGTSTRSTCLYVMLYNVLWIYIHFPDHCHINPDPIGYPTYLYAQWIVYRFMYVHVPCIVISSAHM
jgi:hypothetical protein